MSACISQRGECSDHELGDDFTCLRCGEFDDVSMRGSWIGWLVEVLHYPFDMQFDPPPPVDFEALARHWKQWDDWADVSDEDALNCVLAEAGLLKGGQR